MKKISFLLLAVMAAMQVLADIRIPANFEVTSRGNGVVHIKVAVYEKYQGCNDTWSGIDYRGYMNSPVGQTAEIGDRKAGLIYYTVDGSSTEYAIMDYFTGWQYAFCGGWWNEIHCDLPVQSEGIGCATRSYTRSSDSNIREHAGSYTVTNSKLDKEGLEFRYLSARPINNGYAIDTWPLANSGYTQHALDYDYSTARDRGIFYLEFDWKIPGCLNTAKEIHFYARPLWCYGTTQNVIEYQFWPNVTDCKNIISLGTIHPDDQAAPQLIDPQPYFVREDGSANPGRIAIPYVCMQQPDSMWLYEAANGLVQLEREAALSDYGGMIEINAADTERSFWARFKTWYAMDDARRQYLYSNRIVVPAYHQIHDFKIAPYKDSTIVGARMEWRVKNAHLRDIMETDFFVVERATQSDFSDAALIANVEITQATEEGDSVYSYIDNSPYVLSLKPGTTLYYRVSRGSSLMGGFSDAMYNKGYAAQDSISDFIHLATLMNFDLVDEILEKIHYPKISRNSFGFFTAQSTENFYTDYSVKITIPLTPDSLSVRGYEYPANGISAWDEGARLILTRKNLTTGENTDIVIPKENIEYKDKLSFLHWTTRGDNIDMVLYHTYCATYIDKVSYPCTEYAYSVRIDAENSMFTPQKNALMQDDAYTINNFKFYHDDPPQFNGLTAGRDESRNYTPLRWDLGDNAFDSLVIMRRQWSESYYAIDTIPYASFYNDVTAIPGQSYYYQIKGIYNCKGDLKSVSSNEVAGRTDGTGLISGRVQTRTGAGMAGIKVAITPKAGLNEGYTLYATTDENGNFIKDDISYSDGQEFIVSPVSESLEFESRDSKNKQISVTLRYHDAEQMENTFVCTTERTITGRVLYNGSTIPVPYARFFITTDSYKDGYVVSANADGTPVQTDRNGEFTLIVPKDTRSLRVFKQGHKFVRDGYLVYQDTTRWYIPNTGFQDIRFYDDTRTTLVGRVAGGLRQGLKPVGKDIATNYIGDSLTIVLELEGDNISQIVHDPDNLALSNRDFHTDHPNMLIRSGDTTRYATTAHMTRKRLTIHPDEKSGEFRLDVYPVRWKVVQITAKGYATLLPEGQALPVWDMSTCVDRDTTDNTTHSDTINYIYRSHPQITCTQVQYNIPLPYFGTKGMIVMGLDGQTHNLEFAQPVAPKSKDYTYTFGYPVFKAGQYQLQIAAHEDYYYNNDHIRPFFETVPLKGTARVHNGFCGNDMAFDVAVDSIGIATFPVNNTTFTLTGEQALRTLSVSMDVNGQHVESEPLQGYIMGEKTVDGGVMNKLGKDLPTVLDILRDPYGAGSYSYLEKGTTYATQYAWNETQKHGVSISLSVGKAISGWFGVGAGTFGSANWGVGGNVSLGGMRRSGHGSKYDFTTTNTISTSSEAVNIGAMADVYIGTLMDIGYKKTLSIQPMDSASYAAYLPAIEKGTAHCVAHSTDNQSHLMIIEVPVYGSELKTDFAYTQKYILKTLIPDLENKRNNLLMMGDSATLRQRATTTHEVVYWSKVGPDDPNFAKEGYYSFFDGKGEEFIDQIEYTNKLIEYWTKQIKDNESVKINITGNGKLLKTYDVVGGVLVSHSESASIVRSNSPAQWTFYVNGGIGAGRNNKEPKDSRPADNHNQVENQGQDNQAQGQNNNQEGQMKWNLSFSISAGYVGDRTRTETADTTRTMTRKAGFVLSDSNGSYSNQSVYCLSSDWNKDSFVSDTRSDANEVDGSSSATNNNLTNDFVFRLNGGASRCPYIGADSAIFHKGDILSKPTFRIENPKLQLDDYIKSEVPGDEVATFRLTLSNQSEIAPNTYTGKLIHFTLYFEDMSNPNGAEILIDGMPLTDGRTFIINPGESIVKTMQVKRGVGYDFNNLQLTIMSECDPKTRDDLFFSVHYIPTSSPVNISAPDDKWVLNTLSPKDDRGYYLPVTIDGFNTAYDNFDHIELQYKKTTEGETKWVNLCSYYRADNRERFEQATGNKDTISGGRITNIRFYGERDPIEQRYDLRAVTFCRHGNGFITRASNVVSGIKDTRIPTTFGIISPSNGILTYEDAVVIPFSEDIAGQYLDKDNNFQVMGSTQSTDFTGGVALAFSGDSGSYAMTDIKRSLAFTSFTIDMIVKSNNKESFNEAFSYMVDNKARFSCGIYQLATNGLYAIVDGKPYLSEAIDGDFTDFRRIAFVFNKEDSTITGYVGNRPMPLMPFIHEEKAAMPNTDGSAYGYFKLGGCSHHIDGEDDGNDFISSPFLGEIKEARVWNRALSQDIISQTNMMPLTGYERDLLAYYPINECKGNKIADQAHGANMTLHGTSWQMPEGRSVHMEPVSVKDEGIRLNKKKVQESELDDYTMMLWWKADAEQLGDTVTLFATGRGDASTLFVGLESHRLVVRSGGEAISSTNTFDDTDWHHLAIVVNRVHNLVSLFVDNNLVGQAPADMIGGISGQPYLGSCDWHTVDEVKGIQEGWSKFPFTGYFDYFTLWHGALHEDYMKAFTTHAPNGEELALQAYAPFHEQHRNPNDIYEMIYSPLNYCVPRDPATNIIIPNAPKDTLIDALPKHVTSTKDVYAPVLESTPVGKLQYEFITKDNELQINLLTPAKNINKQQVFISVREVEDLNGNPTSSVITVPLYVDLNRIRWNEYGISETVEQNREGNFSATIINRCGSIKQYGIEIEADWLSTNDTYGSLSPKEEHKVNFTISDGLNPGTYSTIVYVVDEMDLREPLLVEATIRGIEPDWEINRQKRNATGSLYAQIRVENNGEYVIDTDTKDIIGAFVNNTCIGKAHITMDISGQPFVAMTMYGNKDIQSSPLTFRLWRASTGRIYALKPRANDKHRFVFEENICLGCDSMIILQTVDKDNVQLISLTPGMNWISTYLDLDPETSSLSSALLHNNVFTIDDEIKDVHEKQVAVYGQTGWEGDLTTLNEQNVYMVNCQKGGMVEIIGSTLPEKQRTVSVIGCGKWSCLPYLCTFTQSVDNALASFYQNAQKGDCVKSYDEFAVFTADGQWKGSLQYMRPGLGYFLMSNLMKETTITYQQYNDQQTAPERSHRRADIAYRADNMPVVAAIAGIETRDGDVLVAYNTKHECVGRAEVDNERAFLLTYGTNGDILSFAIERNGVEIASSLNTIVFAESAISGSYEEPSPILFGESNNGVQKILYNGHIYILRDGKMFDVVGKKVE